MLVDRRKVAKAARQRLARDNVARMLHHSGRAPKTGDETVDAAVMLQRMGRRYLVPRTANAITIQRIVKGGTARLRWRRQQHAVSVLQPWMKMMRLYLWRVRYLAARTIQANWRGCLPRRRYRRYIGARHLQRIARGHASRTRGDALQLFAGRVLRAAFPLMQDRIRFRHKLAEARAAAAAVAAARKVRREAREARRLFTTVRRVEGASGPCVLRCLQYGKKLDRVQVLLFEASTSFSASVVVPQQVMHLVLRAAYGQFQQLRYLFNKVSLAHLCSMVGGAACPARGSHN